MTPKKTVTLYEDHPTGALKAQVIGGFMAGGRHLLVIRPGYDAQGRRRSKWTQVVDGDIPIWEFKRQAPLAQVLEHFQGLWKKSFSRNAKLIEQAMEMTKAARRRRFRDGESGVAPAPALTRDGRGAGLDYSA